MSCLLWNLTRSNRQHARGRTGDGGRRVSLEIISPPIRFGPSFPQYVYQWACRLSRVKLPVICGTRSDIRRWSCSNCERWHQTVNVGISSSIVSRNICGQFHVHVNTNLIFPKFQTRRNTNDGCCWPARSQRLTQAAPNELKLSQGMWSVES